MLDIRRVVIKNFMGIKKVDIDVESHYKGSLVFILGHNGAGKSSILEALYYAFTGKVPRLGSAKQGLLRQGATDGYIEVQFRGTDGNIYRVRKFFRRSSKGKDVKYRSDLKKLENERWVDVPGVAGKEKEIVEKIKDLLNISGDIGEILRSTFLIMQGKIDEMIKGKNPLDMLSKSGVVPLKEEDIRLFINDKLKNLKGEEDSHKAQIGTYHRFILDEYHAVEDILQYDNNGEILARRWEDFEEIEDDDIVKRTTGLSSQLIPDTILYLKNLYTQIESYKENFMALDELKRVSSDLKTLEEIYSQKKQRLEELRKNLDSLKKTYDETLLFLAECGLSREHKNALLHLKAKKEDGFDIAYIKLLGEMTEVDKEQYTEAYEKMLKYKGGLTNEKIKQAYRVFVHLKRQFAHTTKEDIERYRHLVEKRMRLEEKRKGLHKQANQLKNRLSELENRYHTLLDELNGIQKKLQAILGRYSYIDRLIGNEDKLRDALRLKSQIRKIKEELEDIQMPDIDKLRKKKDIYTKAYEKLAMLVERWQALPNIEGKENISVVEQWVVDYGRYMHLRDGKCPVCGATDHVFHGEKMSPPEVNGQLIDAIRGLQAAEIDRQRKEILEIVKKIVGKEVEPDYAIKIVKGKLEEIEKDYEKAQTLYQTVNLRNADIGRMEKELQDICSLLQLDCDGITEALYKDLGDYKKLIDNKKFLDVKIEQITEEMDRVKKELKDVEIEIEKLDRELKDIPPDAEKIYNQLKLYHQFKAEEKYLYKEEYGEEDSYPDGIEDTMRNVVMYKRLLRELNHILGSPAYISWRREKGKSILPNPQEVDELNDYISDIRKNLMSVVSLSTFEKIYDDINRIVEKVMEMEELDKDIEQVKAEVESLKGEVIAIDRQLKKLSGRRADLKQLVESLPDRLIKLLENSSYEVILDRIGRVVERLEELSVTIKRESDRLEVVQKKIELLDYIRKYIIPSFYKWYIDEITDVFKNILSDNLHTLSGRYMIENIGGDKGIELRDQWTDTVRPVHMLSGGEKTMLGLSFIFALAEMVVGSSLSRVFFIDEAFSALDKDRKRELKPVLENLVSTSSNTIFIITHDERILDSAPPESPVIRMERGEITRKSTVGAETTEEDVGLTSESQWEEAKQLLE